MDQGIEAFSLENHRNRLICSQIPDVCRNEPCCLGIDEAGRGPVLGPMVYGIALCPESHAEDFKKLGCADSKTLTDEQRKKLFLKVDSLKEVAGWAVEIISPNSICNSMLKRHKYSLNEVSQDSAIGLIKWALSQNVNVASVYVDTVGPPEKYQTKLSTLFPGIKFTVAKKADSTYPVVSAASICAKVCRDEVLKLWHFREPSFKKLTEAENHEKLLWGSGYPGDPVTKKFLSKHNDVVFGFPQIVRFSWSTVAQILKSKGANVEWEENDDEDKQKIKNMFSVSSKTSELRRHPYFLEHKLKPCTNIW